MILMKCPKCGSDNIVRNGKIHNGKQRFLCKECGRQFIENPSKKIISQETKDIIDKLLAERISLAGIARVTGVSERWLQNYVNEKYENIPKKVDIKKSRRDVSPSNVTNCGLLLITEVIRYGYGWQKTVTQVRLSVSFSAAAIRKEPKGSGIPCLLFIVSVRSASLISGKHIILFFHRKDIVLSVKRRDRLTISKDLTTRFAREFRVL